MKTSLILPTRVSQLKITKPQLIQLYKSVYGTNIPKYWSKYKIQTNLYHEKRVRIIQHLYRKRQREWEKRNIIRKLIRTRPHNKECPITMKSLIKKNGKLRPFFKRILPNGLVCVYSLKAILKNITTHLNFNDPITNIPYNSFEIYRLQRLQCMYYKPRVEKQVFKIYTHDSYYDSISLVNRTFSDIQDTRDIFKQRYNFDNLRESFTKIFIQSYVNTSLLYGSLTAFLSYETAVFNLHSLIDEIQQTKYLLLDGTYDLVKRVTVRLLSDVNDINAFDFQHYHLKSIVGDILLPYKDACKSLNCIDTDMYKYATGLKDELDNNCLVGPIITDPFPNTTRGRVRILLRVYEREGICGEGILTLLRCFHFNIDGNNMMNVDLYGNGNDDETDSDSEYTPPSDYDPNEDDD